jgi:RNA polymerase sigma-70 factor (ECF subfamily)
MSEEDARWVCGLTTRGRVRDRTLRDLYSLLLAVARTEANGQGRGLVVPGPELDDIACQASGDALVAIIRKLPDFCGDEKFTTWVRRFVRYEVSATLRQHFWSHGHVSLDREECRDFRATRTVEPETIVESREMLAIVTRAVRQTLTRNQRTVLMATALDGTSPAAVGLQGNMNRNAVYKAVFDARRKLRTALVDEGYDASADRS